MKPSTQLQLKLLFRLLHVALFIHGLDVHSSMSKNIKMKYFDYLTWQGRDQIYTIGFFQGKLVLLYYWSVEWTADSPTNSTRYCFFCNDSTLLLSLVRSYPHIQLCSHPQKSVVQCLVNTNMCAWGFQPDPCRKCSHHRNLPPHTR